MLKNLSPLELIPNIIEAAEFLQQNLDKKITIYGDYDVDGITGTTLLYSALQKLGARKLDYYIPHRFFEGYGLNKNAVRKIKDSGTEIILTVDCGISNYAEIKYAKELGLHVLVTDHHIPPVVLPPADFLVNPKLNNQPFLGRNIAGVAVAFKLVEQLFRLCGHAPYSQTSHYLDLVMLGTIADIVPLLAENRLLTIHGLQELNKRKRVSLRALIDTAGLQEKELTSRDIGFALAPRINAAGRLGASDLAVALLLETDYHRAKQIALELNKQNSERQEIGNKINEQITATIEGMPGRAAEKVFILSAADWHPGIIGIVAAQIVKRYNRPTVLIAVTENGGRGSIRSLEGLDIFEPLKKCSYLLKDFGGHKEAAGFEIETSRIGEFTQAYRQALSESTDEYSYIPKLQIDAVLPKAQITKSLAEELEKLSPFGPGNQQPIFSTTELSIYDFARIGGGKHLKFSLTNEKDVIDGVGFGLGDLYPVIQKNQNLEIAFNLAINEWQGRKKLQLIIKDLRLRL
ncbi:putative phosphoesterase DHH family [Candidatus Termititenax persephonae]|uniref:Single-stranded-DNA-specific exonuclease RecJ n=1 Tax=Candidatus Termititenax persephonae TaxID=2218525 RepID=A0A388TH58_9BACT|nr:putative phosphoesterase DHH family [Candidatus Termititenax persephonae]